MKTLLLLVFVLPTLAQAESLENCGRKTVSAILVNAISKVYPTIDKSLANDKKVNAICADKGVQDAVVDANDKYKKIILADHEIHDSNTVPPETVRGILGTAPAHEITVSEMCHRIEQDPKVKRVVASTGDENQVYRNFIKPNPEHIGTIYCFTAVKEYLKIVTSPK